MKVDVKKIEEAVISLDETCQENGDLFDSLGILILDFADVILSKSSEQFNKQKSDCRKVLKNFSKKLENLTYHDLKKV